MIKCLQHIVILENIVTGNTEVNKATFGVNIIDFQPVVIDPVNGAGVIQLFQMLVVFDFLQKIRVFGAVITLVFIRDFCTILQLGG